MKGILDSAENCNDLTVINLGLHTFYSVFNFSLCDDFFWSKSPMLPRLSKLRKDLTVTFIYGADSWIYQVTHDDLSENIGADHGMKINTIQDARHHVYADQYEEFNSIIVKTIQKI